MYGKFVNDELIEAPVDYKTPNGELITNFTNSIELMKAYGFKEIVGSKPDYDSNTEVLIITGHTENAETIECTYEVVSMSSLLKTATKDNDLLTYTRGEVLDARKSTKTVNGQSQTKEYTSLKDRLDKIESVNYDRVDITDTNVTISLEDKTIFVCDEVINALNIIIPAIADVNFSSKIYFETDVDFTLDNILFMGDHCENGKLNAKDNNEYLIDFLYTTKLIGLVSSSNVMDGDPGDPSDPGEDIENTLHSFSGGSELVRIAKTYWTNRASYMTYGMKNILTDGATLGWIDVTTKGADSPDGRYRKLDCSAFVNLAMRGIEFDDVFKSSTVFASKDLSPRTSEYSWATQLSRTSASMCEDVEKLGWAVPPDKWHTDANQSDWLGLEIGDLIFLKGDSDNGRYKNVNHVCIYYGDDSQGRKCIIEFTSGATVKKHSDDKNYGCQIIPLARKNRANIVTVARCQK